MQLIHDVVYCIYQFVWNDTMFSINSVKYLLKINEETKSGDLNSSDCSNIIRYIATWSART